MKVLKYIFLVVFVTYITSCNEEAFFPELETTPPYIQFDDNTVSDAQDGVITVSEPVSGGNSTLTLTVENPFGTINSDINVTYSLGGTAEFGTDYTIPDATETGGSFTIVNRQDTLESNGNPSNARDDFDIEITLLGDGTQDGDKEILITLTSAMADDGTEVTTERNGLPDRSELTVLITDADCGDLAGTYDVTGEILVDDFGSGPYNYTDNIALVDCAVEGTYQIADITGGLYANSYAANYGTSPRVATITIDQATNEVTWSGVSDQFGGSIVEDPNAPEVSNYDPGTNTITIYWTATAFGERGITTYVKQ